MKNAIPITPEEIEERAKAQGISMVELCKEANRSNSTFTRWKGKITNPNIETYFAFVGALEKLEKRRKKRTKISK